MRVSFPFLSMITLFSSSEVTVNSKPVLMTSGLLAIMASALPSATAITSKSPFFSWSRPVVRSPKITSSVSGSWLVQRFAWREAAWAPTFRPARDSAVAYLPSFPASVMSTCWVSLSPA